MMTKRVSTWCAVAVVAAMFGVARSARSETVMQTTTTRYTYDGDGAPIAVRTQVESRPATTTYLTWDNFQNGAAQAGNGNLVGYGLDPDGSQLATRFTYDARDRLMGVATAGQSVDYAYHPASLLASSTLGSSQDALQFYYGNGSAPEVVNMHHPASARWSSFLGPVRYVSDGTEQTLLAPRKDTAGVFDATAQTVTPYEYDPYGARRDTAGGCAAADAYDLSDNPFQYAGEYRDPTWCGVYLRARWYVPTLHTFLQRDRADALQRYGYVEGNPIMHADPTGLSWSGGYHSAARRYDQFAGSGWGTVLSVLPYAGEAMFIAQIAFNADSFFHNPRSAEMFGFSIAAGLLGGIRDLGGGGAIDRAGGWKAGFSARIGSDFAIGAGLSAFAATGGKHHRFDTAAFLDNIGYTAAGIGGARLVAGIGYKPFALTADDLARRWEGLSSGETVDQESALVYRARTEVSTMNRFQRKALNERPWADLLHNGPYHESVVALTSNKIFQTEVGGTNLYRDEVVKRTVATDYTKDFIVGPSGLKLNPAAGYEFVGVYPRDQVESIFRNGEGRGIPKLRDQQRAFEQKGVFNRTAYDWRKNNCHHYADDIVRQVRAIN